jgi:SAM-dependent methyltransferase
MANPDCAELEDEPRERCQCAECGATWRNRATLMALMVGMRRPPIPLPEQAADWSIRGVGLSDAPPVAPALASKFLYTNTYYHQFPHLDITDPPETLAGALDFVVCSDVLEHVPYLRVEPALAGLLWSLKPGGTAVVTVPVGGDRTYEYYPGLTEFELLGTSVAPVVNWIDTAGLRHTDAEPEMHFGGGMTLAFRLFGSQDVEERLRTVGFESVWQPPPMPDLGVPEIAYPGVFIARKAA